MNICQNFSKAMIAGAQSRNGKILYEFFDKVAII